MILTDTLNIIDFLKGPDLLLNNVFRLAQLPVDIQDKELKKRHKAIEIANQMNMPVPPGILSIFPGNKQDEDHLKDVLHTLQDPLNRLLNEMFWFWPEELGESLNDPGLSLLVEGKFKAATKIWRKNQKAKQSFVSVHNLAIIHQYLALQAEMSMLDGHEPVRKRGLLRFKKSHPEAQKAIKCWTEAFQSWRALMDDEPFWEYLKDRIVAYNDPRLPVETADLIKTHMPKIILSINVHLVFSAAKAGLNDHSKRQMGIIRNSEFDQAVIDQTIDAFTKSDRSKITHFCKTAEEESRKDPVHADQQIRGLAEQTVSVLNTLSQIYPPDNDTLTALYDKVTMTIVQCDDTFDAKTQDWDTSMELLAVARTFARGKAAKKRVEKDIKQVENLKKDGNDWCLNGYFELPEAYVEMLECARVYMRAEQYTESVQVLGKAFSGETPLSDFDRLLPYLNRCLSFNFKCLGVSIYNRAYDEYNDQVAWALKQSLSSGRSTIGFSGLSSLSAPSLYGEHSSTRCHSCSHSIYGEYMIRTIEGTDFNFCLSCNRQLNTKIDGYQRVLNSGLQKSVDYMVLSRYFDAQFKPLQKNIGVILDSASEKGIKGAPPLKLRLEQNLVTLDEVIEFLTHGKNIKDQPRTKTFWNLFVRRISSWAVDRRDASLKTIFQAMAGQEVICNELLDRVRVDDYIFTQFVKFCMTDTKILSADKTSPVVAALTKHGKVLIQFQFLNLTKKLSAGNPDLINQMVTAVEEYVRHYVKTAGNSDLSITSGTIYEIIKEAKNYDPKLKDRLLITLIQTGSANEAKATSLIDQANIHVSKTFYTAFFKILGSDHLDLEEKTAYFVILIRHKNQVLRFKALKWIVDHVQKPKRKIVSLIRGLDDPDDKVSQFAQNQLMNMGNESFRFLIEALQTTRENQRKRVLLLLNKMRPNINWQGIEAPDKGLLIRLCIQSREGQIFMLAWEIFEKCYPEWLKDPDVYTWVTWLKYSAWKDDQPNAVVETMLLKIRQRSIWKKFQVWRLERKSIPDIKINHWWTFKLYSEQRRQNNKKPTGLKKTNVPPSLPARDSFQMEPCKDCGNDQYHYYDDTKEYLCNLCGWVSPFTSEKREDFKQTESLKPAPTISVKEVSPIQAGVLDVISDQLGLPAEELDLETDLGGSEYGMDSLDIVEVIMNLEERFDLEISDEDAAQIRTAQDICDYLAEKV